MSADDKMPNIAKNLKDVRCRIDDAAKSAGRNPSDVTLIAVSKTRPPEYVSAALASGQLDFGENRPQELAQKAEILPNNIKWHQIGQLQKNKVRHIIDKVCLIHSVDSVGLAAEINKRAVAIGKVQQILIQVNISGEETKSGVSPDEVKALCTKISDMENVRIVGLMTISVKGYDFEQNKAIFQKLADLAKEIDGLKIKNVEMRELSMGMSHDYEAAIAAGATMVRVGTAVFGERDYGAVK